MKALEQLTTEFPPIVQNRGEDILREYLQYEILRILFNSKHGYKFTFLGGTCIRIVHDSERFSEDLDFDNEGLTVEEFEMTAATIQRELGLLGYTTTIKFTYKGAYHCALKFPGLQYQYGLSGHKEARLLLKIDTEKQGYDYRADIVRLVKFGVDTEIRAVPIELLLSQKITAAIGRKRSKGRDFYDLIFLLARAKPDYGYLTDRLGVANAAELRAYVAERIAAFDFDALSDDVKAYLFVRTDEDRVRNFRAFWQTVPL